MYSNKDILKGIKSGDIKIIPFSKEDLKSTSCYLHLDGKIAIPQKGLVYAAAPQDFSKKYIEGHIKDSYVLRSGQFILARTSEDVAISKKLVAFVHTRSTLARMGVSVVHDAPIIDAGHGIPEPRKITLEIKNSGPFGVVLKKGMRIAEVSFFELKTPTDVCYDAVGVYGKRKNIDNILPCVE